MVETIKITVDSREAKSSSGIFKALGNHLHVETKYLESGDYIFANGVGVERKTVADFLQTVNKRRIWEQLALLCESYEKPMLLIEGALYTPYTIQSRQVFEQLMGAICIILYSWKKVKLMFTQGEKETISYLRRTAVYAGPTGNIPIPSIVKKSATPKDIRFNMLMCIRGIGRKTATGITKHAPSIGSLSVLPMKYSSDEFAKMVPGLTKKCAKVLWKVIKG